MGLGAMGGMGGRATRASMSLGGLGGVHGSSNALLDLADLEEGGGTRSASAAAAGAWPDEEEAADWADERALLYPPVKYTVREAVKRYKLRRRERRRAMRARKAAAAAAAAAAGGGGGGAGGGLTSLGSAYGGFGVGSPGADDGAVARETSYGSGSASGSGSAASALGIASEAGSTGTGGGGSNMGSPLASPFAGGAASSSAAGAGAAASSTADAADADDWLDEDDWLDDGTEAMTVAQLADALLPPLPAAPLYVPPDFSSASGAGGVGGAGSFTGGLGGAGGATLPKRSPGFCIGFGAALKRLRATVSKKKRRFQEDGFDLDLTYITPRIIAMGYPSSGGETLFRNPLPEVQRFFETRHPGRYRIYNLCSERAYDPADFCGRVARFPFDDHNPCMLEVIPRACADMHAWLAAHPDNVIAVHCKAGKGRTGLIIAAYLLHAGVRRSADAALKYFASKRTKDQQGVTIPSQMRFVHYYEKMLRFGAPPIFSYRLRWLRLRTVPCADPQGGCTPYFDVRVNDEKVFDYRVALGALGDMIGRKLSLRKYKAHEPFVDFDLTLFNITVTGNVKLQLYHEVPGLLGSKGKKALAHSWFHTGFVHRNYLYLAKHVIDKACKDKKGVFTPYFAIEIYLERVPTPPGPVPGANAPQPVPTPGAAAAAAREAAAREAAREAAAAAAAASGAAVGGAGAGAGAGGSKPSASPSVVILSPALGGGSR